MLQPVRAVAQGRAWGSAAGGGFQGLRRRDHHDRFLLCPRRGGLTTKIYALVDAEGRPIDLALTAGQAHDGKPPSLCSMLSSPMQFCSPIALTTVTPFAALPHRNRRGPISRPRRTEPPASPL